MLWIRMCHLHKYSLMHKLYGNGLYVVEKSRRCHYAKITALSQLLSRVVWLMPLQNSYKTNGHCTVYIMLISCKDAIFMSSLSKLNYLSGVLGNTNGSALDVPFPIDDHKGRNGLSGGNLSIWRWTDHS